MENNNTISLDDLSGNGVPTNSFDMTGGVIKAVHANNDTSNVVPVMGTTFNEDNIRPVDINAILPKRQKDPTASIPMYAELDAAVQREKQSISQRHEELFNAMKDEVAAEEANEELAHLDASIGEYASSNTFSDNTTDNDDEYTSDTIIDASAKHVTVVDNDTEYNNNTNSDVDIVVRTANNEESILGYMDDDKLFDDSDDDDKTENETTVSDEDMIESIKKQVRERIVDNSPRRGIDLSKFTFAKKGCSVQKVMKMAITGHQNIADWVLPVANRTISMTGLSGPEILKLDASNSNRNKINTFKDMYGILYKHVVDANKPEFEVWLKQMRFTDLQHIYFAAYMATFSGSSFTNYACPHCNNVFIHDIEFKDLVNYKDDAAKAKVQALLHKDTTSTDEDTYDVEMIQVSERYAFGLRTPSIWTTIIEIASLSDKFLEKHADLIDVIAYIDSIYLIDYENSQLVPVDTKPDPNDLGKTVARRVKSMHDIISTLSSEEYYTLTSAIAEIDKTSDEVTYKLPSCTCPKCNKEIPENTSITPDQLLFTRHQLAAIANTSN